MIMACACNKNRVTPGVAAKRTESTADTAASRQARETRTAENAQRASASPAMHGRTQSFALQSNLERAAAAARARG